MTHPAAPRESAPLLEVRALSFGLLEPVDLTLEAGECVALWGPSGSGKSRLLRALADLDRNEGDVWLDGRARGAMAGHEWRRLVGLLPPDPPWWHDTVGAHFEDLPAAGLAALGLPEDAGGWEVRRLSTGEKQRLGLLRLAAIGPRVLLLDEPTANLDTTNAGRVERFLANQFAEGAAAIWVSHDPDQRKRVATRELTIQGGRLEIARPHA